MIFRNRNRFVQIQGVNEDMPIVRDWAVADGEFFTATDVRNFTEYMWQFSFFTAARKKVLHSLSTETSQAWVQTLRLALVTSQGAGRCDRIDVVDWDFEVDKSSGDITKNFEVIRSLDNNSDFMAATPAQRT